MVNQPSSGEDRDANGNGARPAASGRAGPTASSGQNLQQTTDSMRRDDDRRRDDARVATLQNQVDELRLALRELASRQLNDQEQMRAQAAESAQLRIALEQARQESHQSGQARALDENRTRQVIQDLEARIDNSTRPIRSLQAHVTELLEAARRKGDDTSQNQQRFDEIVTMIEHLSALGERTSTVNHTLRDGLDSVRAEIEGFRRDIIRAEDAIKIVDQEARRRTTDVQTVAEGYSARIDELRAELAHIYDSLEDTRRGLVHVDPTLEELRAGELGLRADLNRLQAQLAERHDQFIDMQEDARQETDARFDQLRQVFEERIERINERLDESSEQHRELTYKVAEFNDGLEELRQVDASTHRDVWFLHEQRVRVRMEQIQEELDTATEQRRQAEADAQSGLGNRFRRRRPAAESPDF